MNAPAAPAERICAALDFGSWAQAEPFARAVAPAVGMLKVGLELFTAEGPAVVRAAAALGRPVFLDLKLHDIPNTVEGAARSAAASGAALLTVHASGGAEMIRRLLVHPDVELVRVASVDFVGEPLSAADPALEGIEIAYYLAHAMGAGERGFAERDRQAARNFALAARGAGVW